MNGTKMRPGAIRNFIVAFRLRIANAHKQRDVRDSRVHLASGRIVSR